MVGQEACWELHQPSCETRLHQLIISRLPQSLRGVPVTRPYLSPKSCAQLVRCASNSCTPVTEAFPPKAQQIHSPNAHHNLRRAAAKMEVPHEWH